MMLKTVVLILSAAVASAYFCPYPEICECLDTVIVCECKHRETINIRLLLHLHLNRVIIHGCGTVSVKVGAVMHLGLDLFEVSDVHRLEVHSFAFSGAEYINSVKLISIGTLLVSSLGFSGLANATEIILKNVTAPNVRTGSFTHIANVERFIIEDSVLNNVENIAFLMSTIENFEIRNTYIGSMQNTSILIREVNEVKFVNNTFVDIMFRSFVLINVHSLSFTNCFFGYIPEEFMLSKSIDKMAISSSNFSYVQSNAMYNTDVISEYILSDNTFGVVEENSLIPNMTDSLKFYIDGNRFNCNCKLSWLWTSGEHIYSMFVQTSSCVKPEVRSLSTLAPEFNARGQCLRLDQAFPIENIDDAQADKFKKSSSATINWPSIHGYVFLVIFFSSIELVLCTSVCLIT